MLHKALSCIEEVPYCFLRSTIKFQGQTALKIIEFDADCAFPDCNSSLNSPMGTKRCTKLEVALKRCPIVFQGHPSNFKVARLLNSSNLTQIGHFRTVTPIWFTNGYKMIHKAWSIIEKMPYCFWGSSVKFLGHTAKKIVDFDPNRAFLDCNSNLNSPMGMKWCTKLEVV